MKYDYEANKSKLIDSRGVRLTAGLFEELNDSGVTPVFKLSDWRKVYVDIADPTGYQAAMALIGDWEHWQLIAKSPAFAPHLEAWNREVEVKLRSDGLKQLIKQSKGPTGTAAARYLAEAGYARGDGRKKKKDSEEVDKAVRASVAEDAKRLGLTRVK